MRPKYDFHPPNRRPGQVLVEFALIALVPYFLLAATIELGRAIFGSQTIQAAADLAAREISRTPLSVTYTSLVGSGGGDAHAALNDKTVRQRIFDERLLVIDLDLNNVTTPPFIDLDVIFASFPVVNQQLRALMIFEQVPNTELGSDNTTGPPIRHFLRYPGAIVTPGNESAVSAVPLPTITGSGFASFGFRDSMLRIAIPVVESRTSSGVETIRWVSVMEEITPGAFSVTYSGSGPSPGTVGIRLNYPFQAATLSAYQTGPNGPFEPGGTPVQANDTSVTQTNSPVGGGSPVVVADPDPSPNNGLQPYGGKYGLGFQLALGQTLRPFRSLLSGQAIYRREVFTPQPN